jgi:hypothetical protein
MSVISDLLSSMTTRDSDQFIDYLKNRSKRKEGRNIELFRHLKAGTEESLKKALGSNTYNVLKMRLTESLIDFLSGSVFENELTKEAQIIRKIVLGRKMLQLEKTRTGTKILLQAEKTAESIQHFTLLNEIYHSLIEISHLDDNENQDELIEKLEENTANFLLQERLNLVYAQVRRAFNQSEQGGQRLNLNALIERNFEKYGISPKKGFGLKSLYQLAMVFDYSGAQSRNYHQIDLFLIDKVNAISEEERNNERNHLYHIDLLYTIANIYFRKRDFQKSIIYLENMMEQMLRFDGKFLKERLTKHQLLLALNHNFDNEPTIALKLLEAVITKKQDSQEGLQAYLSQIMILAQQGKFAESNVLMKQLYRSDTYYRRIAGLEWVINRRFLEIILHIELDNIDFAMARIESLSRQYADFFKAQENTQAKPFLRLVKHYLNNPSTIASNEFRDRVEKTIPWETESEEDIFFISIYAWLKAKMIGDNLYATTLKLLRSPEKSVKSDS